MIRKKVLILGGGISGLAALRAAEEAGLDAALLEAEETTGGLSGTERVGTFHLDRAGHLLHLSRFESPSEIPYAGLDDAGWQRIPKRAFAWIGGRKVRAPVQYHLAGLGETLRRECEASYLARPARAAEDFRSYLVSGFGERLAELFLIPQNEKTWAVDSGRISLDAVKRFFPPPDERLILAGLRGKAVPFAEYNSHFWYPKAGGIGLLAEGLARGASGIHAGRRITAVDLEEKTVRCADGSEWGWETLLTSLPLKALCRLAGGKIADLAGPLSHSSAAVVNLIVKEDAREPLEDVHWIYTPDADLPFYRVGVYSNLGSSQRVPGFTRLYAEIGMPARDTLTADEAASLAEKAAGALAALGWIGRENVVHSSVRFIPCAYVHYTPERAQAAAGILEALGEANARGIGRYGLWEYGSMEDSILSAIDAVRSLA